MPWLQINSAKDLRDGEPDVLRVLGQIESAMGRATALEYYEKLSEKSELNADDLQARAEIATRFGNEEQFAEGIDALEKAGKAKEAGELRTARQLRQGDIDRAIAEARSAVAASDDPAVKLTLARLLARRYGPEFGPGLTPSSEAMAGADEVVDIVDQLLETPERKPALAFALNEAKASPEVRLRWANAAMEKVDTGNPALLPAAAVLVRSGQKTPRQIHEQLRPVFDAAPLERRAAYVLWLTGAGMPKETLTMITAQEAGESTAAFGARTEALFGAGNLDAVLDAVESGGNVDDDVRLAAKARAEYARGRGAQGGSAALREAMGAAAKKGRLELILPSGESLGASSVIDEKLVELCGDPALSDYVFRIARDRFSRSGRASLLAAAHERALAASPESPAVRDYQRYLALTESSPVGLNETAAAAAAEPANVNFRVTHALNLLRNEKPREALEAFDTITVFADRLPPGQLAVIAAVLAANDDMVRARAAAAMIEPGRVLPGEYALIAPLRAP
jgi:tetratricopeptide (TPR) repeat protein